MRKLVYECVKCGQVVETASFSKMNELKGQGYAVSEKLVKIEAPKPTQER